MSKFCLGTLLYPILRYDLRPPLSLLDFLWWISRFFPILKGTLLAFDFAVAVCLSTFCDGSPSEPSPCVLPKGSAPAKLPVVWLNCAADRDSMPGNGAKKFVKLKEMMLRMPGISSVTMKIWFKASSASSPSSVRCSLSKPAAVLLTTCVSWLMLLPVQFSLPPRGMWFGAVGQTRRLGAMHFKGKGGCPFRPSSWNSPAWCPGCV